MADTAIVPVGAAPMTAKEIIDRYGKLKSKRDSFYMPIWRSSAEWLCPRKSSIAGEEKNPGEAGWVDNIFDITAQKASERLAAWLMTNTSPANARWFAFTSGPRTRARLGRGGRGAVDQWWQHVTEVTLEQLQGSNFYTEKHESVLDRNNFGTCALGVFRGKRAAVNFRNLEVGSYVIDVDDEGFADSLTREFKLTARQAVRQFGKESLGPKVLEALDSPTRQQQEFTFYHAVEPNHGRNPMFEDSLNKTWKSTYVCKDDELIVQEGGFDGMPYPVSRFLKWKDDTWGWAPAFTALPVVRMVNFNKMQESALLELAAFPPMAEPSNMAGQLDLRAGGRNVYDESMPDAFPKPLYQPDMRAIQALQLSLQQDRQFIDQAFFGDVIQMFAQIDRQMTAFEVARREGEKLDIFSPYYFRLINELDTPLLERTFSLLLEQGMFEPPPDELIVDNGNGTAEIDLPEVIYLSRLALAVQAHEIQSFDELVQRAQILAQIDPAVAAQFMKPLDLQRASRGMQRNLGLPTTWQRTPKELEELEAAEAEQAQAMQAAETAPGLAKAAKDVDSMSEGGKNRLAAMAQNN